MWVGCLARPKFGPGGGFGGPGGVVFSTGATVDGKQFASNVW